MNERTFQSKAIQWGRAQGAYIIKTRPGMGTPTGCPDSIWLYGSKHADIEFKASAKAPYRPGQEAALDYLERSGDTNRFVYTAYPENWQEIQADLLANFFQIR